MAKQTTDYCGIHELELLRTDAGCVLDCGRSYFMGDETDGLQEAVLSQLNDLIKRAKAIQKMIA